jgi:2,3-bisphosphoglycerate-independent phosphoglycerate mutase
MATIKPCVLMILDGWGNAPASDDNAVSRAQTPVLDELRNTCPHTQLTCSGEAVGLPAGIMGNSEVGHLNIGAGRIVYQDLLRIDRSIIDGSFRRNATMEKVMAAACQAGRALHLMGLVSDGGVHSQLAHLLAVVDLAAARGVEKIFVHAIMDGRDTPPDSGRGYIESLASHLAIGNRGRIATICGRYYAMDRDSRWERVEKAYAMLTDGVGRTVTDPVAAVEDAYARGETDEFIEPVVLVDEAGAPRATLADGDIFFFFNFRADRAREITRALTDAAFDGFSRNRLPALGLYATMTRYDESFAFPVAFGPQHLDNVLGEVVSRNGLAQLRIAETEKYAHVTYFFNGGEERPFEKEDRCLIPSPRDVATYDQKPEMSAVAVTEELLQRFRLDRYHLVILNFANMDMVGHTGVFEAAVKACETIDRLLGSIVETVRTLGGALLITADHGNAEKMRDEKGDPHTAHTTNPVTLMLVDDRRRNVSLREGGILADIAPTILEIMELEQPPEMTGASLILEDGRA